MIRPERNPILFCHIQCTRFFIAFLASKKMELAAAAAVVVYSNFSTISDVHTSKQRIMHLHFRRQKYRILVPAWSYIVIESHEECFKE